MLYVNVLLICMPYALVSMHMVAGKLSCEAVAGTPCVCTLNNHSKINLTSISSKEGAPRLVLKPISCSLMYNYAGYLRIANSLG